MSTAQKAPSDIPRSARKDRPRFFSPRESPMSDLPGDPAHGDTPSGSSASSMGGDTESFDDNYSKIREQGHDEHSISVSPNRFRVRPTAPGAPSYLASMPKVDSSSSGNSSGQADKHPLAESDKDELPNAGANPSQDTLPKPLVRITRQSTRRQFLQLFVLSYAALQTINAIGTILRTRSYVSRPSAVPATNHTLEKSTPSVVRSKYSSAHYSSPINQQSKAQPSSPRSPPSTASSRVTTTTTTIHETPDSLQQHSPSSPSPRSQTSSPVRS